MSHNNLSHQDWEPVILTKPQKDPRTAAQKSAVHTAKHFSKLEDPDFVPDRPNTTFSKFLQKARLHNKLNQKSLATKLNVQPKTIQLWESGKEIIPGNHISKLNRLLNVNIKKNTFNQA
jgi:ribosome-binding protein aMBF1 (putative translation factor)